MTIFALSKTAVLAPLSSAINHLWQSTVIFFLVWGLTACFTENRAALRFRLWLVASLKFLVPFSLLIVAGQHLRSAAVHSASPAAMSHMVTYAVQPYPLSPPEQAGTALTPGPFSWWAPLVVICLATWAAGVCFVLGSWWRNWLRARRAVHAATFWGEISDVPVFATREPLEPGIFGVFRPVLLISENLLTRLPAEKRGALFAHELCHVRRRDNLAAAIHTFVSGVFWFHPAVWIIRARLLEERERACDEAVVRSGADPETYAETILDVCRLCIASSGTTVAGVSGGTLRDRMERIMLPKSNARLSTGRKALLVLSGSLLVSAPLFAGLVNVRQAQVVGANQQGSAAPAGEAPSQQISGPLYDVSTVKPHPSGDQAMSWSSPPGEIRAINVTLGDLIADAWGVRSDQVTGEPAWANNNHWDVTAKATEADPTTLKDMSPAERHHMDQALLAERFHVKAHLVSREGPIYDLVLAPGGLKIHPVAPAKARDSQGKKLPSYITYNPSPDGAVDFTFQNEELGSLIANLALNLHQTVIDKTGISPQALFSVTLHFASDRGPADVSQTNAPPLREAVEEQLGLRLVPTRGPVPLLIVDHADKPEAN